MKLKEFLAAQNTTRNLAEVFSVRCRLKVTKLRIEIETDIIS